MHYRKTLTTTIAELNARHKMKKRWKMHKRKPFSSFNSTVQHSTALNDSENEIQRTKETSQNQTNRRINEEKEDEKNSENFMCISSTRTIQCSSE